MTRLVHCFLLALFLQSSQSEDASSTEDYNADRNPVAVLLSNLRSLVENPGPPFEDGLFPDEEERRKEPMYGRPRQDYFKRIRENYGKLQRQVGSVLEELSIPKNLFGSEGSTSVDVRVPFLPVNVKVKTSAVVTPKEVPGFFEVFDDKRENSVATKGSVDVSIPSLDVRVRSKIQPGVDDRKKSSVATNVQLGDVKVSVDSDSKVLKRIGQIPTRGWIDLGEAARTGRGKRQVTDYASEAQKRSFSTAYHEFLSDPAPAVDFDLIEPGQGRILGEVFYSEEAFDNMTKEAIKNAKWALDSDLDPAKIIDKLDAVAKLILQRPRPKSKAKRTPEPLPAEPKETVVLALTEEGVPVQVRIGPEVDNPFRFLHAILSAAQVVLRVRIEGSSASDPDLPAPLLFVDLSDPKQRNSFLKTLRKFRSKQD